VQVGIVLEILFNVIGGLGIFLLGMKNMSEGMQAVAGDGLRRMIGRVTGNRFVACTVGTLVTCVVQSSSVTTVLVVGLTNGGFMTLTQAIGVIMGANIGTTITGWILVLKIGKYGLPLLGLAAVFFLFSRRDRIRYTAMAIMGIGMVFFGLELMASGFKPLRTLPAFVEWFHRFQADSYLGVLKCAMVGCFVTMIVQSSSATLGITIGLAEAGMIPFHTAAALVLGENIGTTITALLASLGTTTNARRAAVSHSVFNVVGVLWITPLFPFYMRLVEALIGANPMVTEVLDGAQVYPHMRAAIALTHSGFNVVNTLIFLPLLPLLARLVTRLLPERAEKEIPHLTYLNVRMLDTPAFGIEQSLAEIKRMGSGVMKMFGWLRSSLAEEPADSERDQRLYRREEILDVVQREVVEFLSNMVSGNVSHEIMNEARMQLRVADELESISDYLVGIKKLERRLVDEGHTVSAQGRMELLELHDMVTAFTDRVVATIGGGDAMLYKTLENEGKEIKRKVREIREHHLARMQTGEITAHKSLIFSDMLTSYRKIKDHGINIVEALAM
jgi:phosphate:Na+ symporter